MPVISLSQILDIIFTGLQTELPLEISLLLQESTFR